MYKIGERYLSPELGRWTQPDPAANRINPTSPGEPNPYAYAACDPINNTDPTGLFIDEDLAVAIASTVLACLSGALAYSSAIQYAAMVLLTGPASLVGPLGWTVAGCVAGAIIANVPALSAPGTP